MMAIIYEVVYNTSRRQEPQPLPRRLGSFRGFRLLREVSWLIIVMALSCVAMPAFAEQPATSGAAPLGRSCGEVLADSEKTRFELDLRSRQLRDRIKSLEESEKITATAKGTKELADLKASRSQLPTPLYEMAYFEIDACFGAQARQIELLLDEVNKNKKSMNGRWNRKDSWNQSFQLGITLCGLFATIMLGLASGVGAFATLRSWAIVPTAVATALSSILSFNHFGDDAAFSLSTASALATLESKIVYTLLERAAGAAGSSPPTPASITQKDIDDWRSEMDRAMNGFAEGFGAKIAGARQARPGATNGS